MNTRSQRVLWIALGLTTSILLLALILIRRLCRSRQPIQPYHTPQIAYITPAYQQGYWPAPSYEQPPPSYDTAMNMPPVKQ